MKDWNDEYLMMIEPEGPASPEPDDVTEAARQVWAACKKSDYAYRGFHRCRCGKLSDNRDYTTPEGRTTNSLPVHYVAFHRDEVPRVELGKLMCEAVDLE